MNTEAILIATRDPLASLTLIYLLGTALSGIAVVTIEPLRSRWSRRQRGDGPG